MKLLWTNPNPRNSFNAQTISLDLSGYRFVMVSGAVPTFNYQLDYVICEVGQLVNLFAFTNSRHMRQVTVSATGVTFGQGMKATNMTETTSADNNTMIPQKIWGIK